jgi:hypothetical protein
MVRSMWVGLVLVFCCALPVSAQVDPSSLEGYFTGKMVVARIDMPGSEKGVDLAFNKATPLDWKDYSSRLTSFGVAIHKGDAARVTKIVLKGDHIEFHLDGGGYGTFGEDTSTTVVPVPVVKSQREKDLEKQVADAKDPKQKRDLQNDLDRERERREHQDAENKNAALIASQIKAQQVAEKRLRGGSRFNLKWQGSVPSDDRDPETVMKLLADYVDFDPSHANVAAPVVAAPLPPEPAPARAPYVSASGGVSQLKRGMKIDDVTQLLGQGRVISQSVSSDGLNTQVVEFRTADSVVDVTCVEGVVVRYSINSR